MRDMMTTIADDKMSVIILQETFDRPELRTEEHQQHESQSVIMKPAEIVFQV